MKIKTKLPAACFFLILLFFTGCVTTRQKESRFPLEETSRLEIDSGNIKNALSAAGNPDWKEISPGVMHTLLPDAAGGIKLNVVRINLANVKIQGSQPAEDKAGGIVFEEEYAEDLAERTGAVVAVNMTPFFREKKGCKPIGIYVNSGRMLSPPNERYAAILFYNEGKAEIIESQNRNSIEGADFAFGGYWSILKDGRIQDFPDVKDSRTAIGINETGSIIFILTAENPHLFKDSGISFPESAVLLKALGASNAIQMDGGFSTNLVVNGKTVTPSSKILFFKKHRKTAVNAVFIPR